jgi:succinoglycan biosynthesis protein ExoA
MKNQIKKLPNVSIIIPCFNEENTIEPLLEAIKKQNYPLDKLEVVISDAISIDQTKNKILNFSKNNSKPKIVLVDNPKRTIPSGVNIAAANATGEILVRLDAHSEPNPDYIGTSVELLTTHVADNVGGIWNIQPGESTCIAKAIAKSAAHPLGVGDAQYRVSEKAQYTDTVPFGAFYKNKFNEVGCFDESLLANEDYEFNARLRKLGGKIWLDPRIQSKYYSRKNLKALAKQYWGYGYWKVKMLLRYPKTIRIRQAIPPLFTMSIALLAIISFFLPFARIILEVEIGVYILALLIVSINTTFTHRESCFLLMPFVMSTMHFSWGSGFIYSLLTSLLNKSK